MKYNHPMEIEFEAKFFPLDKATTQSLLQSHGAILVRKEYLQKRVTFDPPPGQSNKGRWLRVRDEGDKVTLSFKQKAGIGIESVRELSVTVDDFQKTMLMLEEIGCIRKSYQETKRELWKLEDVEVTIDEWPWLEPFIEIEGRNEAEVKKVASLLGLDYSKAIFGAVDQLYVNKYGIDKQEFNGNTPMITFATPNPFSKN